MRDDSEYRYQAYLNGGDGYGKIVDFYGYAEELPYQIIWDNGHKNSYDIKHFKFVDDEENIEIKKNIIKWYKNGKLEKE